MKINFELIEWYLKNGRQLPWRSNTDAYTIWLSEIILQQTRVTQGLNYFIKFKNKYPTIFNLAQAPIDEVLKLWQGLGYYTRARNLHQTAQTICKIYNGIFPNSYDELKRLKGIGDYTAAAIASISYKIPVAVVDGNVYRVLSRLFGIFTPIDSGVGKKEFATLAQTLIDKSQPDVYNQAIMDFGALACTPKNPDCNNCPFIIKCFAYQNNCIEKLPIKVKKTKVITRYFTYLIIAYANSTYIKKRLEKDIWHSLCEFPLIEDNSEIHTDELVNKKQWNLILGAKSNYKITHTSHVIKHKLSHQIIICKFIHIEINKPTEVLLSDYQNISFKELRNFSVSRLIDVYISNTNFYK